MVSARLLRGLCLVAGPLAFLQIAKADYYTLILQGNVVMPDGSAPPKSVGLERDCSDIQATGPGPLTDKKGHYTWRMDLDPENTRVCTLRAMLPGFTSTRVDIANLNLGDYQQNKLITVPNIVLAPRDGGGASETALISPDEVPGKAQTPYKAAVKALDSGNSSEGINQLQLAVKAVPKFADGWTILGMLYEQRHSYMEARDALQHALEANPKLASPYLRLARIDNKLGDFAAAAKNEDALLKIENRFYPEIYLQQGITRFELKDLSGAEESLKTALSMNPTHKLTRAEYVLGMIALAKGDVNGAKEHLTTYVKGDPAAQDIDKIQAQLESLGKPDAPKFDIALERP